MDRKLRVRVVAAGLAVVLPIITTLALAACAAPVPATQTVPADRPALGDIQTRSRDGMTMVYIGRGGSWYDDPWHVRSAYRKGLCPSSYQMHWIGLRCAVPAPSP